MNSRIFTAGGTSGIGFALVKKLINQGDKVFVASRDNTGLSGLEGVDYQKFDASSENIILENVPDVLDGFVYFPGTINLRPFSRLKPGDFEQDWRINFLSAVGLIQQLFPSLKKGNNPSIVMISTVAVQNGMNFHSSISSAKGAVEGLVRSLAAEFAPTIRVNAIAPSLTDTPLAERLLNTDAKIQSSGDRHPLKRVGKIDDQVNAIEFLLSEKSSWITGHILPVDGGLSTLR